MYVYILRSQSNDLKIYIGMTSNLNNRLKKHNDGNVTATKSNRPWEIEVAIWLKNSERISKLEKYLKSGSGRAFSKKRFGV